MNEAQGSFDTDAWRPRQGADSRGSGNRGTSGHDRFGRQQDRCESVCWRRSGESNISDMAAQLDHADSDGLLRDNGAEDSRTMEFSEA